MLGVATPAMRWEQVRRIEAGRLRWRPAVGESPRTREVRPQSASEEQASEGRRQTRLLLFVGAADAAAGRGGFNTGTPLLQGLGCRVCQAQRQGTVQSWIPALRLQQYLCEEVVLQN